MNTAERCSAARPRSAAAAIDASSKKLYEIATLASRLRQYGSHLYFESVEQLCYDQHDGPPLGFCGARCHRLYQPWIDVMEDCVSDMGVDY